MEAIPTNNAKFIDQQYTNRVLKQEASNIFNAQDRVLARFNSNQKNIIQSRRSFTVNSGNLQITHSKLQRFIDMKNIRGLKRKPIPNHNVVIYGHFNNIINKLAFGLTQDVKNAIAGEFNIQL